MQGHMWVCTITWYVDSLPSEIESVSGNVKKLYLRLITNCATRRQALCHGSWTFRVLSHARSRGIVITVSERHLVTFDKCEKI